MIFKHRELFSKLSLLSKSSIAIEIVFNGTRVILNAQNAIFQPLIILFWKK